MTDKTAEYAITADPSGFAAGMDKAQAKAKEAGKQIEASFKAIETQMASLSNMFKSVTSVVGTLTAVIAGGAAFKEVIDASNAWAGEAKKVSMALGVTTERASVLNVAMRHLGIDSDMLVTASQKVSKQIFTNSDAFEKMGVKVRDANGEYRPALDIMAEVNTKLKDIKNPIEQNIAGTQVYGKSWAELRATLKLTTEELRAAEQKTKDLGLVVGEEGVANAKKYKESMNDMKLVVTSLEVQLGAVLLPVFVKLGAWLSSVGPTAGRVMGTVMESLGGILETTGRVVMQLYGYVRDGFTAIGDIVAEVMGTQAPGGMEIFSNALKVIEIAFVGFETAFGIVMEVVKGYIEAIVVNALRMADAVNRALHGDFSGAKAAWNSGSAQIEDIAAKHAQKIVDIAKAGKDKVDAIVSRAPKAEQTISDKRATGGPKYEFKPEEGADKKPKSRASEWEAKLAAEKDGYAKEQAIAGTAREYSASMEGDYWKRILDTVSMSKEERSQVEKKYYAVTAAIRKESFDSDIAGEKAQLENYKNNHLARLEIAERIHAQTVARFGEESKEAKAAMADIFKERRAYAEQVVATDRVILESQRNSQLAAIDAAEQEAQSKVAMQQMTDAQLLDLEAGFEAKRYQIKMQALQEREAALRGPDEDPVALAQLHAQIEQLEQQHMARINAIRSQASIAQNKTVSSLYGSVESGMARVISGTMQGTIKMSGLLRGMLQSVTGSVIDMLAQVAAKWLMNQLISAVGAKVSAISQITANAGVAGAAATASAAAIPMIGWAMAPEAGLMASAAAMAYMPMASARQGYDIPAGLNPIVQTHAREMILPEKQADAVREMAEGGGTGGGVTHIHINAADGDSVRRMLINNKAAVADAIKSSMRDFRR